ncbi:ABC transporter ATP-binding protein [Hwanghaeella grinnelliae]|uniref:ABC transporter ATP-binding protein n=1 Tax=Hwanghaeella grinnelliae TaxID=2500179 RepID=A0A3S2VTF1_9PROT|nr:ABC transporter ATP-binding protein [Hwanghaeella grinnelliae]RVU39395.1 ABC transporter ATP-binding protein [Hwanghaeella grinnelliae]
MTEAFLELRDVTKSFTLPAREVVALSTTSLQIEQGALVCLLGPSGCGKSTLLRLVAGFEQPSGGNIIFHGKPISSPGPERGMIFQDYALFPWLTVRQNVAFGPRARGMGRRSAGDLADRYLDMVGLNEFAEVWPHQLSGGMRQRVAIARVLANDAKLVLMDEPFGALDAMTRERLQQELLTICAQTGLTVLFVTHSIEEAVLLGDRVIVMSAGPGRVVSDLAVSLPHPRDPTDASFNDIRRGLSEALHGGHSAAPVANGEPQQ